MKSSYLATWDLLLLSTLPVNIFGKGIVVIPVVSFEKPRQRRLGRAPYESNEQLVRIFTEITTNSRLAYGLNVIAV
jgi:hypothetical protein